MNSQTIAILFATLLVVAATLIPTYIISKRSATSEDDWAVADRSLPIYVVIGTQFASAMGGGILVGHLGNAYLNGVAILIYGFLTALPFFFILIPAKWLRQNNFSTVPEIIRCRYCTAVGIFCTARWCNKPVVLPACMRNQRRKTDCKILGNFRIPCILGICLGCVYGYEHQHTESRFGSEQRNRLVHVTAAHTSAGWFCRTGVCNNDVYCI